MLSFQDWQIENIEALGYDYDFYKLECEEAKNTPMSFLKYCLIKFNDVRKAQVNAGLVR